MAKLIYSTLQSLDGYIEDEAGKFDWAAPDEEVHVFFNDLERSIGTHLLGRRMYEVMSHWDRVDLAGQPPHIRDFAEAWRATDKVVYSKTLEDVSTPRARLERDFDPAAIRELKATASQDLSVGGPGLAATAFAARLVDELHLAVVPTVVGAGKPSLAARLDLDLLDERRFAGGTMYLRYRTRM